MVDADLEKLFDRVNHDVLMGKLHNRIADQWVLRIIRRYLGRPARSLDMSILSRFLNLSH